MTNSVLALSAIATFVALVALLAVGSRWKRRTPFGWLAMTGAVVGTAVVAGHRVWDLPDAHVAVAGAAIFGSMVVVTAWRRQWNPAGQAFVATIALTCASFLVTSTLHTFSAGLSVAAVIASVLLTAVEAFAFLLLMFGTHEVVDVVARVRWDRLAGTPPVPDPAPFVSVQVAAHNEPPELVIGSLRTLRQLDYPAYEVIVLDNNTDDESLWRPVKDYCDEVGFRFVRLVDWPGFKAGALNHGLEICDPRTEIMAFVDADFLVDKAFLAETVGHFSDPSIAIVQTGQDFRFEAEQESEYLRRLALTYKAFDEVTMPSRNERDSIIFAGTMGLIRKSALEEVGGWSEWCVTEDAETSLRILAKGYSAQYVGRSYGRGVMPLTFASLKKQRFRWCFGGVQLMRRHWRVLLTGRGTDAAGAPMRLTGGQRFDYLAGGLQWFQGLLTTFFSLLLLAGILFDVAGLGFRLRPMVGVFIAVPLLLLVTGLVKSLWGLRARLKASWRDAFAVMGIWLALNWTVGLAAGQAALGKQMAFMRTPKFQENQSIRQALLTTRAETPLAFVLFAGAALALVAAPRAEAVFLSALCFWGGLVYAAAPLTALAASRVHLDSTVLRRRRALEGRASRSYRRPLVYGFATAVMLAVMLTAGSSLTEEDGSVFGDFDLPERSREIASAPEIARPKDQPADEASPLDRGGSPQTGTRGSGGGNRDGGKGTGGAGSPVAGGSGAPAAAAAASPAPAASGQPAPQSTAQPEPAPQSTAQPEPAPQATSRPQPTARPTPQGTPRSNSVPDHP